VTYDANDESGFKRAAAKYKDRNESITNKLDALLAAHKKKISDDIARLNAIATKLNRNRKYGFKIKKADSQLQCHFKDINKYLE
jgi:hypothetical protein